MFLFFLAQSQSWEFPTYPSNFYSGFNGWIKAQGKVAKMVNNKTIFGFPVVSNFNASYYIVDMLEPYKGTIKSMSDFQTFASNFSNDITDKMDYLINYLSDKKQLTGLIIGAAFAIIILLIFLILIFLLFLYYCCTCCCCCKPKESTMPNWCSKGCMLVASALYLLAAISFFFIISPVSSFYNTAVNLEPAYNTIAPEINSSILSPILNNVISMVDDVTDYLDVIPDDTKKFTSTVVNSLNNSYNKISATIKNTDGYNPSTDNNPKTLFDALDLLQAHVDKYNSDSQAYRDAGQDVPKLDFSEQIGETKDQIDNALDKIKNTIDDTNDRLDEMFDPITENLEMIKDLGIEEQLNSISSYVSNFDTVNLLLLELGINPNITEVFSVANTVKYPFYSIIGLGASAFLILLASTWCIFCGHGKCSRCQASCCPCCHLVSGFFMYLILGLISFVIAYVCVVAHETVMSLDTVINYVPQLTENGKFEISFSKDITIDDVTFTIKIDPIVIDISKMANSPMDIILHSDTTGSSLLNALDIKKILNTDNLLERFKNIPNWFNNTVSTPLGDVFAKAINPIENQIPQSIKDNENYPKDIDQKVEEAKQKIDNATAMPQTDKDKLKADLDAIRDDIDNRIPNTYDVTYKTTKQYIFDKFGSNFMTTWNDEFYPSLENFLNATVNVTTGVINHLVGGFSEAKLAPISKIAALFTRVTTYNISYAFSAIFIMCHFGAVAVFISSLLIYIRRKGMMDPDADTSSYDESSSYDYDKSSTGKKSFGSSSSSRKNSNYSSSSSFSSSSSSGGNARRKRRYS